MEIHININNQDRSHNEGLSVSSSDQVAVNAGTAPQFGESQNDFSALSSTNGGTANIETLDSTTSNLGDDIQIYNGESYVNAGTAPVF